MKIAKKRKLKRLHPRQRYSLAELLSQMPNGGDSDFTRGSEELAAWQNRRPVGREFGSPDGPDER